MMQNTIRRSMAAHRQALEWLYTGICTVYEQRNVTDEVTKITRKEEVSVLEEIPCKLSYKTLDNTVSGDGAAEVSQAVVLFCAPEWEIKPGSKIVVTQNGRTGAYSRSGLSGVFSAHQEIPLRLFTKYA